MNPVSERSRAARHWAPTTGIGERYIADAAAIERLVEAAERVRVVVEIDAWDSVTLKLLDELEAAPKPFRESEPTNAQPT